MIPAIGGIHESIRRLVQHKISFSLFIARFPAPCNFIKRVRRAFRHLPVSRRISILAFSIRTDTILKGYIMNPQFADMFAHMRWADRRAFAMLRESGDASPEAWKIFYHVLASERLWLSRIFGRPAETDTWPVLTPEKCEEWMSSSGEEFRKLVAKDSGFDAESAVEYRRVDGTPFRTTLSDILTHSAFHGNYHRGQIAKLLRQAGCVPVPTDYIVYCREGKPE